ncbi:5-methylcytosine rRNA methyltransferase NSUN4-like [Mercenaria mercenaria]|uniref:5-methylcytosine rRNA methyltransferase NSUN4-like n=1 Tax=Mercenaria mercenaria TaxID=6596 RepID=UPI00234FA18C|nr:5-methylcytosine rRNA methyltransferase NSUN4-like [Mercenaria mercenaria]
MFSRRFNNSNKIGRYFYRGFKVKKDQGVNTKVTNSDRALEHFDLHYRPVYKNKWPSIRIALLTSKKTCAVMNNFAENIKFLDEFKSNGAYDIIEKAEISQREKANVQNHDWKNDFSEANEEIVTELEMDHRTSKFLNNNVVELNTPHDSDKILDKEPAEVKEKFNELSKTVNIDDDDDDDRKDLDRTNLYNFVPAETVYSETHMLRIEEAKRSVFTPMDVKVDIVKPRKIVLPFDLKVIGYPSGDVTEFPDVKVDNPHGYLCFFMMDAASILPVIALDLEKGDNVLDLCAAPGGKSLTILQTGLAGNLTCNDLSGSRIQRLLNILQYYIPEEQREHVTVTRKSGLAYDQPDFDKVLVDVPCNTDRHYLLEDVNNLFSPSRISERIEMPTLQKDLLLSGIKSCRPGGSVVYSTCTLSPAQNDGVIQNALDDLWRNTNIDVVVEDLEEITDIFKDSFQFYKNCRFGQLVLPSLSLNYGPMYFCRLRRVA